MNLPLVSLRPAAYALAVIAGLGSSPALAQALAQPEPRLDVVYVPTPQPLVDRMLDMAQVKPGDYMIDFGCGDGRMVISAAKRGARGYGVDINPVRIEEANENAKKAGVTDRVEFKVANLFEEDLSKADVMAMYLLPDINLRLRPKILNDMKPGTRIVSHDFSMGEWKPEQRVTIAKKTLYFWVVPAKVEGKWQVEGDRKFTVDLSQQFQMLSGTADIGGKPANVSGRLRGADITLTVDGGGKRGKKQELKGKVDGNQIVGTNWKATKS
jgi:SAM-dependent methyltransferase